MITPGLEAWIQKGKAQEHTFVFGAGAVGRIPCPENSFIIIHHFDYWHFIDPPFVEPGDPAKGAMLVMQNHGGDNDDGTFTVGATNFNSSIDFADAPGTQATVQAALTAVLPGWTVEVTELGIPDAQVFEFAFTSPVPGLAYNGFILDYASTAVSDPPISEPGVTANGTAAEVMSIENFLTHSEHQLEFRSSKSRNHFLIREPVVITPAFNDPEETLFTANLGGVYPHDCYLVHTEAIQINLLGVPPVEDWSVQFLAPSDKAQEFPLPVGYGTAGTPSESTVLEVFFDAAGPTQQYLPLTASFENIAAVAVEYREQFKVDVNAANALNDPTNVSGVPGNYKTYPLINISYVVVQGNYNQFVQASS